MFMLRTFGLISCLLPLACPAQAAVTLSSGAYDTSVHISAAGVVVADATTGAVTGSAPPSYDRTGGGTTVNQNFTLVSNLVGTAKEGLQTGLVSSEASGGGTSAVGTANLANVSTGITNQLLGVIGLNNVLTLGANAITSTTTVGIGADGLTGTGSSTLAGLTLGGTALGGLSIDGLLYANPTANTVLLSLAGLTVTLNEQLRTANANGLSMQTNAVHIALNNYALDGSLLSGDIVLGHSEASIAGVPEPASWALMLIGFGSVGIAMRRTRPRSLTFI